MRRDFRLHLDDILEAIHQIRTYLADQNEEAFTKDRKTQDAVIRNLAIIGKAAGNLSEQIQKGEPEIDWRREPPNCLTRRLNSMANSKISRQMAMFDNTYKNSKYNSLV
jgi:hypothetical protein